MLFFNWFYATGLFPYPWKDKKQRFSDVFRRYKKRPVTWNELIYLISNFQGLSAKQIFYISPYNVMIEWKESSLQILQI